LFYSQSIRSLKSLVAALKVNTHEQIHILVINIKVHKKLIAGWEWKQKLLSLFQISV